MDEKLIWYNDTRKLADLKPQEDNPRQISKVQAERLLKSWDKFSQVDTLAIGPDGSIYNGHQRYYVLLAAHDDPQMTVDVRVASRQLERREWQELTVLLHEGATGEWSWDALANWEGVDVEDLVEWGFERWKLGVGEDGEVDYDELWQGMPEFEQEYNGAIRTINVYFANEQDIEIFSRLMEQSITEKTKGIWYPKREHLILANYGCDDES